MALVGVVIGSKTDIELIQPALDTLKQLDIDYELSVISAHRNPEKLREYGLEAEKRGLRVIVAAAGRGTQDGGDGEAIGHGEHRAGHASVVVQA